MQHKNNIYVSATLFLTVVQAFQNAKIYHGYPFCRVFFLFKYFLPQKYVQDAER